MKTSLRILPIDDTISEETAYLTVKGTIMNSTTDSNDAPSLYSYRNPEEEPPLDTFNHEIRLLLENNGSTYYLPSLCFALLENSILEVQNIENLPNERPMNSETNSVTNVTRVSDNILSAVYNFQLNNTYMDDYNKNHYNFVISPYTNLILSDDNVGYPEDKNNIFGTREFEIGKNNTINELYSNISLLIHGSVEISAKSNIFTNLYWVGISLYYTNHENLVCTQQHALTLNIKVAEHSEYKNFFPCFAISKKKYNIIPDSYLDSATIPQFGENKGKPIATNTSLGIQNESGKYYQGDGVLGEKQESDSSTKNIIQISQKINLDDCINKNKDVYIVLLPLKHENYETLKYFSSL